MKSIWSRSVWYSTALIIALSAVLWPASFPAQAQPANVPALVLHYADIVLYNGKVIMAEENFTIVEAVAIRDNKFLAVGTTAEILPLAGPRTRRIDLKGKAVTPGIVDVHQHPFGYGMMTFFLRRNNVQWEGVLPEMNELERDIGVAWMDVDSFLRDVGRAVAAAKPGEWIVIPNQFGRGLGGAPGSPMLCAEVPLQRLDAVSPNNPVVVIGPVNLRPHTVNSQAVEALKLPQGTTAFQRSGLSCPTRETGAAVSSRLHWAYPLEEKLPAFRYAQQRANRYGVTMVKEHQAQPMLAPIRELWARGELTIRERMPIPLDPSGADMSVYVAPEEAEKFFQRIGNYSGIGDDMWRFVNVRPQGVGGNMLGTPWTFEPKQRALPGSSMGGEDAEEGALGGEIFTGRAAIIQAIRYGWDVSFDHTVGDRAVAEALKAIEEALKTQVVKRPNQIITINHTPMARAEEIKKMKELGVRPSVGPWHVYMDYMMDGALHQYGVERVGQMIPMGTMVRAGVKPALEGDTFYTPPFWRMEKIITRKDDKYQKVYGPTEKVTRQQALWMSTLWGAYNLGEDKKLGSIETGKLADLIVIDKDYLTIPEDDISEIKVLLTIVDGKVVHEMQGAL